MMLTIRTMIRTNKLGLSLLLIGWALFFGRVFLMGNVFFLDDLKIIYYPLEIAYAQFQQDLELPLWSNDFGFGHPLLAWGQLGFFTPIHVILRALGLHPLTVLQGSIALYFLVGLTGFYAFLRKRNLSQISAALGAYLYVFSGFTIGHLNHVNFYTGTMLLPLLLLALLYLANRPSLIRTALVALAASAITVSAQPQVVLLVFIAVAIIMCGYLLETFSNWKHLGKVVLSVALAGIIALCMSSLAILPLWEFIPETERAADLSREELLEFSFPPYHAITLILPYFYGDHDNYWGAKGFQELAVFTGLIPLLLAGGALSATGRYKTEQYTGIVFLVIAAVMALGRYSLVYAFLVEHLIFSSFAVASRFVFFFNIAIALLGAVGLELIIKKLARPNKYIVFATGFCVVLFGPFAYQLIAHNRERIEFIYLLQDKDLSLLLVLGTAAFLGTLLALRKQAYVKKYAAISLVAVSTGSLLAYSWNFNPVATASSAYSVSPFQNILRDSSDFPRIYSRPYLLQTENESSDQIRYSDHISPTFSLYQPLPFETESFRCLFLPLESSTKAPAGSISIGIHSNPREAALQRVSIPVHRIGEGAQQRVCYSENTMKVPGKKWLSITSTHNSEVTIGYTEQPVVDLQAYFVRKQSITEEEWQRSQKPFSIAVTPDYEGIVDEELAILARHLNVSADTSSARWIGALSIRPYREFIEQFFANDRSPSAGDGNHIIQEYRHVLNMAGVTHLSQLISPNAQDTMTQEGYELISEFQAGIKTARLYRNPDAFPKAYVVPQAFWRAADDETRFEIAQSEFDPRTMVYLSGPKPPESLDPESDTLPTADLQEYEAEVVAYTPTRIDVRVRLSAEAYLVVTDSTTPAWQTYIDNKQANQYVANSLFKAAIVPAGEHTVSFRYESPATNLARRLSIFGLAITALLLIPYKKLTPR